jgi:hypothetical protein
MYASRFPLAERVGVVAKSRIPFARFATGFYVNERLFINAPVLAGPVLAAPEKGKPHARGFRVEVRKRRQLFRLSCCPDASVSNRGSTVISS